MAEKITGLEQEEIKIDENLGGVDSPVAKPINNTGLDFTSANPPVATNQKGQTTTGFSPLEVNKTVDFTANETTPIETADTTGIKVPQVGDVSQGGLGIPGPTDTTITDTTDTIKTTGIEQVDTELDKLRIEKKEEIEDTFDSYNLAKGRFEENKTFYTNFDETNTKFEGVLGDLRALQQSEDITTLTDEQLQVIANKNGVTLEQVKDPTTIYGGLELTEAGKDELGVTSVQDSIDKMDTDFTRGKEDLAFNLDGQKTALNNQLEDVKIQLERNLAWMDAQGAFTGAFKSSGFVQGIQNVKDDGERTIARLEAQLERVDQADATNIARLTEDYTKASAKAKKDLDDQLKAVKFDTGLQMNKIDEQLSSTELTKALDAISEEFGTKSMKVFGNYVDNMRKIQTITNDNIIQQDKIDQLTTAKVDRRFNELIANDGLLLQGATLPNLQASVKDGSLTVKRFADLKNLMQTSIVGTLNQSGTVNQADINSINSMMEQGMTPTQIVSKFQAGSRFTPKVDAKDDKIIELNDGRLYDVTNKVIIDPSELGDSADIQIGAITQDYGATSPLTIDNVELADGTTGTPGVDIDGNIGDTIKSFSSGKVTSVSEVPGFGKQVIIEDSQGNSHLYNHLNDFNVTVGDSVNRGTQIATMGNTGSVIKGEGGDGSHLDYRVSDNGDTSLKGGNWVDPNSFIKSGSVGGELTTSQELAANALAGRMPGSKKSTEVEKRRNQIIEEMKAGKTIDQIEDDIRLGAFGEEFSGDFKSAFSNITVKGFSKEQKADNQAELEDKISEFGADSTRVKSFLKRLSVASMDADSSKKVKGYETLEKTMSDIKSDLKSYEESGGDTGIFEGKTEGLTKRVGRMNDPELRKIATKIAKAIQVYRQGVSGAAFTESESQEYKNIFPSIDNIEELNAELIDAVLESNTISIDSAYGQQMGIDEYNSIFKTETKEDTETATDTKAVYDSIYDKVTK